MTSEQTPRQRSAATGEATDSGAPADDYVLSFSTDRSRALGRLVRLGPLADEILRRHAYPDAVGEILGQALALTGMLGSTLKFDGNLILQTQTDGALSLLVANYEAPGRLRGYAGFDADRRGELQSDSARHGQVLGTGHLALTIDPGRRMNRYQGIVSLAEHNLTEAAGNYFRQSEQLPTFIRLAVARHRGAPSDDDDWHWRAGGIMVQYVSPVGGRQPDDEDEGGNSNWLHGEREEDWQRVAMLAATVEDHELLDPTLGAERLLYRLFNEEGVRASEARPLEAFCRCSRERVETFLTTFENDDIAGMLDEGGKIAISCEFCNEVYRFDPVEARRT